MSRSAASILVITVLAPTSLALAVPGPDSVAVVANVNDPESVALAELYREARSIPHGQVCMLDLPLQIDMDRETYLRDFEAALETCLEPSGALERLEAVVIARGVPLRVTIDHSDGAARVSTAAAVGIWKSTFVPSGDRVINGNPGRMVACGPNGQMCLGARHVNPFRDGVFGPGFRASATGVEYELLIATMLHGRSYADAARLVASATTAEANPPAPGDFVFMRGADAARGVLDGSYQFVARDLRQLGLAAEVVDFDRNLIGQTLAGFFVGTAGIGDTIEMNTYLPGSLVDNLTSFGAVPDNFALPEDERQVSIARWVAQGVAGVHGTTDEPLNNCFPSRYLILDYAQGGTLGEAYFRNMPWVFWRNLVLGDPMAAPYAERPNISVFGVDESAEIAGAVQWTVSATHSMGIQSLAVFADGVEIGRVEEGELDACLVLPAGETELLIVAQAAADATPLGRHAPKGWRRLALRSTGAQTDCLMPDAGTFDTGPTDARDAMDVEVDAGTSPTDSGDVGPPGPDEGCSCGLAAPQARRTWTPLAWFALIGAALGFRRRL